MKNIFRGGFRINGLIQGSYPLAKLSVGENLELKIIFSKSYEFKLDEIIIKIKEGITSNRI